MRVRWVLAQRAWHDATRPSLSFFFFFLFFSKQRACGGQLPRPTQRSRAASWMLRVPRWWAEPIAVVRARYVSSLFFALFLFVFSDVVVAHDKAMLETFNTYTEINGNIYAIQCDKDAKFELVWEEKKKLIWVVKRKQSEKGEWEEDEDEERLLVRLLYRVSRFLH